MSAPASFVTTACKFQLLHYSFFVAKSSLWGKMNEWWCSWCTSTMMTRQIIPAIKLGRSLAGCVAASRKGNCWREHEQVVLIPHGTQERNGLSPRNKLEWACHKLEYLGTPRSHGGSEKKGVRRRSQRVGDGGRSAWERGGREEQLAAAAEADASAVPATGKRGGGQGEAEAAAKAQMLSPTRFTPNACPCLPLTRVDAVHCTQRAADSVSFLLLPNITVAWFSSDLCVPVA
jgi:hypothetical protein